MTGSETTFSVPKPRSGVYSWNSDTSVLFNAKVTYCLAFRARGCDYCTAALADSTAPGNQVISCCQRLAGHAMTTLAIVLSAGASSSLGFLDQQ